MAAYLVEQLCDAHGERRAVTQSIAEMEQRMSHLQRRQVELEGLVRKYIEDLDHWASKDGCAPAPMQPDKTASPEAPA
jgi:DNA repair ATPase RecN